MTEVRERKCRDYNIYVLRAMFTTDEDECSRSVPVALKTCAPRLDHTHDSFFAPTPSSLPSRLMGEDFEQDERQKFVEDGFEKMVSQVADLERVLGIYDLNKFRSTWDSSGPGLLAAGDLKLSAGNPNSYFPRTVPRELFFAFAPGRALARFLPDADALLRFARDVDPFVAPDADALAVAARHTRHLEMADAADLFTQSATRSSSGSISPEWTGQDANGQGDDRQSSEIW